MSKMQGGFCIAGIYEKSGKWVRPVKRRERISLSNLATSDHQLLRPLELVEFDFLGPRRSTPYVEDWLTNFSARPVIIKEAYQQPEAVLNRFVENNPDVVLKDKNRSLILIEPESVSIRIGSSYSAESVDVRFSFALAGAVYDGETPGRGYPCTDLRLRAWAQMRPQRAYSDRQLRDALGAERVFLVVGLSREYQGNNWPMVVGVHTWPDYQGEIDVTSLR